MSVRTEVDIDEETTYPATVTLTSDGSTPIASANIDSITMTLIEVVSGDVINSRSNQNVFNTNNCTVHATSGLFTFNVQAADSAIVNTSTPINRRERHLATGVVTYNTTDKLSFEILLNVKNLRGVT